MGGRHYEDKQLQDQHLDASLGFVHRGNDLSGLTQRNMGRRSAIFLTPATSRADRLLTSLKAMLIKIGAKIVSHGRHVACQMAEVAIRRATLPPVPGGHVQKQESNQTPGAGNDNWHSVANGGSFTRLLRRGRATGLVAVCKNT